MSVVVHHGDCREIIQTLGVTVDAVVTDPPYGLEFMGAEWDAPWQSSSKSALFGKRERELPGWGVTRNANCRACGGRLRGARKCECAKPEWDEAPNATHLRQMHAYAEWCADWAGELYEVMRPGGFLLAFGGTRTVNWLACGIEAAGFTKQDELLWLYATGFPKHKAHLKPAYEPIVLAYKPGGKRTMQVDECRIGTDGGTARSHQAAFQHEAVAGAVHATRGYRTGHEIVELNSGRWPANICHDGSDEVVAAFPESAGSPAGEFRRSASRGYESGVNLASRKDELAGIGYGDSGGSAARFFFSAKAGAQDRWGSRHPTVKPVELMKWLVQLVTPAGGLVLDPFAGSGTTGVAALATGRDAILIEREDNWFADIRERVAFYEGTGRHSMAAKNRSRKAAPGTLL